MSVLDLLLHSDLNGVLCRSFASRKHNLSTFPDYPIMFFQVCETPISTNVIKSIPVSNLDTRFTEKLTPTLYITNKERTICDMISSNSEERFIYESLETYLSEHSDYSELDKVAGVYGLTKELDQYKNTLADWIRSYYDY